MVLTRLGKRLSVPRYGYAIVLMACSVTVVLTLVSRLYAGSVWDDAYMFARYADNWLRDGRIAWNPGGEVTYGLTSPAVLLLVVPLRLILTEPGAAASVASQLSGLIWLGLLALLSWRMTRGHTLHRRLSFALLAFTVMFSVGPLAVHFGSGMDTTLALAFLTVYLLLLRQAAQTGSLRDTWIVSIWSGLTFAVRPDLLAFACGVPAVMCVLAANAKARRLAALMLAITVLMTVSQVALATAYFGDPYPLPFYAKGLRLYGDAVYERYEGMSLRFLRDFLLSYWYLFFVIGVDLFWDIKAWWRDTPASHKALLFSTLGFLVYHTFFVLAVMGMYSRFLYPALPPIWVLTIFALRRLIDRVPPALFQIVGTFSGKFWITVTLLSLICVTPRALSTAMALRRLVIADRLGDFAIRGNADEGFPAELWFQLARFSALPDSLVIATTEVGKPAALNPGKVIIDLAGLNTADFAHPPFNAHVLFEKYHPDLIYLPHPHYREMIAAIAAVPVFKDRYEYWDVAQLEGAFMGVAIWRDSPHYSAMRQIVDEGNAQQKAPGK